MTNENSFSLITERVGELDGTVNHFAKSDFGVFRALFHYDFSAIERDLGIDCFTTCATTRPFTSMSAGTTRTSARKSGR